MAFPGSWPSQADGLPRQFAFPGSWPSQADGLPRQMAFPGNWPSQADGLPRQLTASKFSLPYHKPLQASSLYLCITTRPAKRALARGPSRRLSPCALLSYTFQKKKGRCVGPKARFVAPHLANGVIHCVDWVRHLIFKVTIWISSQPMHFPEFFVEGFPADATSPDCY